MLLINNHKDCFVEKPLSHEIIETKKILDYAKKKKIIVFVGQNLRFHPAVKKAKQWIDNKIIGKVLWSRLICSSYLPDWRKNYDFKKNYANNKKAGGVIFDCIQEMRDCMGGTMIDIVKEKLGAEATEIQIEEARKVFVGKISKKCS